MSARKAAAAKRTPDKKAPRAHKKTTSEAVRKPASKSKTTASKKTSHSDKYYYFFSVGKADGNAEMRDLLGGKGANLAEMCRAKIPVPPGFTMSTEVCRIYYEHGLEVPKAIDKDLEKYVKMVEQVTG
ncbi:MAG: pyruvate, phosphate dikinase, partial [candidate division Zixibacteria bacterium]|nr:pyruvate, phosphate dikinase [candidate division Zixibacteria bacterium]